MNQLIELERRRAGTSINLAEIIISVMIVFALCYGKAATTQEQAKIAQRTAPESATTPSHQINVAGEVIELDSTEVNPDALEALTGKVVLIVTPETSGAEVSRVLQHLRTQELAISFQGQGEKE